MDPVEDNSSERQKRLRSLRKEIERARKDAYDSKTQISQDILTELQKEYQMLLKKESEDVRRILDRSEQEQERTSRQTQDFLNQINLIIEENERLRRKVVELQMEGANSTDDVSQLRYQIRVLKSQVAAYEEKEAEVSQLHGQIEELKSKLAAYEEKEATKTLKMDKTIEELTENIEKAKKNVSKIEKELDELEKNLYDEEEKRRGVFRKRGNTKKHDDKMKEIRENIENKTGKLTAARRALTNAINTLIRRKAYEEETAQKKRTREQRELGCLVCGSLDINSECGVCHVPKYCSITCAREHWIYGGHAQDCCIK